MQVKWIGVAAVVAVACVAEEGGPRWVRLTLADRTVLEGELVEFKARTYRVRSDGATREVSEDQVAKLEFLDAKPSAGTLTAQQLLAERLATARESGALERVLGVHHYELVEWHAGSLGDEDRQLSALMRTRVAVSGQVLTVETDVLPHGGEPHLLDADLSVPYRVHAEVGVLDGALRRYRVESATTTLELAPEGGVLRGSYLQLRKGLQNGAEVEFALTAEQVESQAVYFVLAPLLDVAATPRVTLELLRPKGPADPGELTQVTALPGSLELEGRSVRRLEVRRLQRDGTPRPKRTEVAVATAGALRGSVVRLLEESFSGEPQRLSSSVTTRVITLEVFESKRAEWKLGFAAPFAGAAGSPVALVAGEQRLTAAAKRVDAQTGWFVHEGPGSTSVVELSTERGGDRLRVRLRSHFPGGGEQGERVAERDSAGTLQRVEVTSPSLTRSSTLTFQRTRPDRLLQRDEVVRHGLGARDVRQARLRERAIERTPFTWSELGVLAPVLKAERLPALLLDCEFGQTLRGALIRVSADAGVAHYKGLGLSCPAETTHGYVFVNELDYEPDSDMYPKGAVWVGENGALGWGRELTEEGRRHWSFDRARPRAPGGPFGFQYTARAVTPDAAQLVLKDPEQVAAARARQASGLRRHAAYRLHSVHKAQLAFRKADSDHDGELDFAESYAELVRYQLVSREAEAFGYRFHVHRAADAPGRYFSAVAEPVGKPAGRAWLAIDSAGKFWSSAEPIRVGADGRLPAGLKEEQ